MSRFRFLDAPGPLAFAHRGGHDVAPENTLRSFRAAHALGFRYLETDLHITSDGRLVAFHDDVLDRVTDHSGPIAGRSWSELADVRIAGTDPIPTFDDLLDELPEVRWNVDPKSDDVVVALAAAIRRRDLADRVNIGAFSRARLERIRRLLGPELCTTASPSEVTALLLDPRGRRARRDAAYGCLQVPVSYNGVPIVTERFVDAAHGRGAQVHVWTVDDPVEMHRLLDLGVDGIMTDRPAVLREVLASRDLWRISGDVGP